MSITMHRQATAWEKKIPLPQLTLSVTSEGLVVDFIAALSQELSMNPQIFREGPCTLWFCYPNSSLVCENLFIEYAYLCAFLSRTYPCTIYGNQSEGSEPETARLTARILDDNCHLLLKKQNISGKDFEQISDICVKIEYTSEAAASQFEAMFQEFQFQKDYFPVKRTLFTEEYLLKNEQVHPSTYFRFIPLGDETVPELCVCSLTLNQCKELWLRLLVHEESPLEFYYVLNALKEGTLPSLILWELSLRLALEETDIRISYENQDFRIICSDGRRLQYNYELGTPAQKLFLKILFPVAPARF